MLVCCAVHQHSSVLNRYLLREPHEVQLFPSVAWRLRYVTLCALLSPWANHLYSKLPVRVGGSLGGLGYVILYIWCVPSHWPQLWHSCLIETLYWQWRIQGVLPAHVPLNGTQFFFCILFHRKAPVSEVGAPQRQIPDPPLIVNNGFHWWLVLTISLSIILFITFCPGSEMLPCVSSANHRPCISDMGTLPPDAGSTKPIKPNVWPMSGLNTFLYNWKVINIL